MVVITNGIQKPFKTSLYWLLYERARLAHDQCLGLPKLYKKQDTPTPSQISSARIEGKMRIYSFNVNGLRAIMKKDFMQWVEATQPDMLCLQETKLSDPGFKLELDGYHQYYSMAEKKGYSGTAVFSKQEPISVSEGIGIEDHDKEGRTLIAEYEDFYLISVYVPNSQDELKRLDYRQIWDKDFEDFVSSLKEKKSVIFCGDLNVAHEEIDIKNPKTNIRNAGFTIEERNDFSRLLSRGFIDSFRYLHPDEVKYSWWSYRMRAREKNIGWRIDYFVLSEDLKDKLRAAEIHNDVYGSDHCPVSIDIEL